MLIKLIRNKPEGKATFGQLLVDCEKVLGFQSSKLQIDTLENTQYVIPAGFYRTRLTFSPKFKEVLPILDGVIGRSGIRIHAGNTIDDTEGCILVGAADMPNQRLLSSRKTLNHLRDYLSNYQKQNPNEEIYIEITEQDPYPLFDIPCSYELQMR